MKDIYTGLFDAFAANAKTWYLPSLIGVGVFAFVVFPRVEDVGVFGRIADEFTPGERLFLCAFVAMVIAILASALSQFIYRLFEGYFWPRFLGREARIRAHRNRRDRLRASQSTAHLGLLAEKVRGYPVSDDSILPTRLGNALRAAEDYGTDCYGLDVAILWHRISAVAPEELRLQVRAARSSMDTWMSVIAVSVVFAGVSLYAESMDDRTGSIALMAGMALALVALWYSLAVGAAQDYGQSLRALVDIGRFPLAEALGLGIPLNRVEERKMWKALTNLAAWGVGLPKSTEWEAILDTNRVPMDEDGESNT